MAEIEHKTRFRVTPWGSLLGAIALAVAAVWLKLTKVYAISPETPALDAILCVGSDLGLAGLSGLGFAVLAAWMRDRGSLPVHVAVSIAQTTWFSGMLFLTMVEHQSWTRSGTLLNWSILSYTLEHYEELSAVIRSETDDDSWRTLAAVTACGLVPLLADVLRRFVPRTELLQANTLRPVLALIGGLGIALSLVTPDHVRVHPLRGSAAGEIFGGAVTDLWSDPPTPDGPTPEATEDLLTRKLSSASLSQDTEEARPKNLLVFVLESTRHSATTVYNPEIKTTPHMLQLAQHGLVVERAFVDIPHTSKALVSILCGFSARWVQSIEEAEPGGINRPCVARVLRHLGYATGYFQSATGRFENRKQLVSNFGYDHFRAKEDYTDASFEQTNYLGLEDKVMTQPMLEWIDSTGDKPFFATALTTISHHDYGLPKDHALEEFRPPKNERLPTETNRYNRYLNTVAYADSFIGDVVAGLEKRKLLEDTVIVVVGDHGQGFREHNRKGHNDVIYNEGIQVPLIVSNPRLFKERVNVSGLRRHVDIAPTVLNLLGVSPWPDDWMEGLDLQRTEGHDAVLSSCWYNSKCASEIRGDHKVVDHYGAKPLEFYDLSRDPLEQDNLLEDPRSTTYAELSTLARAAKTRIRTEKRRVAAQYKDVDEVEDYLVKGPVQPQFPLRVLYGENIEILGYDAPRDVDPGSVWNATIYFRCIKPTEYGWKFFGHLETIDQRMIKLDHHPAKGKLKLWNCKPGSVIADRISGWVPPTFPNGYLTLQYGVFKRGRRLDAKTSLPEEDNRVSMARVRVTDKHTPELSKLLDRSVTTTPPEGLEPMEVNFSESLTLVGAKITPSVVKARSSYEVITAWKVNRVVDGPWRIFIHMDPPRGHHVKEKVAPVKGLLPVAYWKPGTYVIDRHRIFISPKWGWPDNRPTKAWVGIFAWGERLAITSHKGTEVSNNRALAGTLIMEKAKRDSRVPLR